MKERIVWIDIAKAVGIYLVVLGHGLDNTNPEENVIRNFIYIFHMPLFFLLSGYLFKKQNGFGDYLHKNVYSLIVPYLFLNVVALLLRLPIYICGYHDIIEDFIRLITGDAHAPAGPAWFLLCLFWVRLVAFGLSRVKLTIQIAILFFSAFAAYIFPYRLYWCLDSVLMALPFYMLGCYMKGMSLIKYIKKYKAVVFFMALFLTIGISIIQESTAIYSRQMGNFSLLYYPGALIGIIMTISACALVQYMNKFIMTMSSGSIIIMGLHGCFYSYMSFVFSALLPENIIRHWEFPVIMSAIVLLVMYYPILFIQKNFSQFIGGR